MISPDSRIARNGTPARIARALGMAVVVVMLGNTLRAAEVPELFLSLSGVAEETIEPGEPLRVTLQIEAPRTFGGTWSLAPATGTWADAVTVEILPEGRTEPAVQARVVGQPEQPHATIAADRTAGGMWRFRAEDTERLSPGAYRVRARLVVRDGAGWKGTAESDELPLTVVASSAANGRAGLKTLALARDALLSGETERSARLLDEELERSPGSFRVLLLRAAVAERAGNLAAAQLLLNLAAHSLGGKMQGYPNIEFDELSRRVLAGLLRPAAGDASPPPVWSWPPEAVMRAAQAVLAPAPEQPGAAPLPPKGAVPASPR
jgi:hypothetical protein